MHSSGSFNYKDIISHYEDCLLKYGDSFRGVDWPNEKDALTRYKVMLDIIKEKESTHSILDFGCGLGGMLEYINKQPFSDSIQYTGLDISSKFIEVATKKFPGQKFIEMDILESDQGPGTYDYILMNGVFTEKRQLSEDDMWAYFTDMIERVYRFAEKGIAFNVMSKQVDWERDDLFHLSMDRLAAFLTKKLSRHYVFRNDYGLYEFTCYVYKTAQA
jgi:SAM-dependent methyltransferase